MENQIKRNKMHRKSIVFEHFVAQTGQKAAKCSVFSPIPGLDCILVLDSIRTPPKIHPNGGLPLIPWGTSLEGGRVGAQPPRTMPGVYSYPYSTYYPYPYVLSYPYTYLSRDPGAFHDQLFKIIRPANVLIHSKKPLLFQTPIVNGAIQSALRAGGRGSAAPRAPALPPNAMVSGRGRVVYPPGE